MSLPSNWMTRVDSEEATLRRGGASDQSTYNQTWIVDAGLDPFAAHAHFSEQLDGTSGTIEGKYGPYHFNFDGYAAKHLGNGYWEVVATYITSGGGSQESGDDGGGGAMPIGVVKTINYNSTGATQHITSGLTEQRAGPAAVDMKLAIGVNNDNVDGVDIVVPVFEWSEEYEIPGVNLSASYFQSVAALTGTINQLPFRGYAIGEVLFLGISGGTTFNPNQKLASEVASTRLSFRFAAKKTAAVTVGGITLTPTNGWDYVWIRYEDDAASGIGLKKPVAIYANRVYKYGDFRDLRLPGA